MNRVAVTAWQQTVMANRKNKAKIGRKSDLAQ